MLYVLIINVNNNDKTTKYTKLYIYIKKCHRMFLYVFDI